MSFFWMDHVLNPPAGMDNHPLHVSIHDNGHTNRVLLQLHGNFGDIFFKFHSNVMLMGNFISKLPLQNFQTRQSWKWFYCHNTTRLYEKTQSAHFQLWITDRRRRHSSRAPRFIQCSPSHITTICPLSAIPCTIFVSGDTVTLESYVRHLCLPCLLSPALNPPENTPVPLTTMIHNKTFGSTSGCSAICIY
jgi:hypothetical protein